MSGLCRALQRCRHVRAAAIIHRAGYGGLGNNFYFKTQMNEMNDSIMLHAYTITNTTFMQQDLNMEPGIKLLLQEIKN